MNDRRLADFVRALGVAALLFVVASAASAQVVAPKVENVPIPPNVNPFNLSFEDFKKYSSSKNFELIGQSYFKVPERTPWAKGQGRPGGEVGSGFNTVRVYDGIAYLGGYNSPPTLFGILIADVRDPKNIKPLSVIPCNPGTRCNYLRVNKEKKILIFAHDYDARGNPNRQPAGEKTKSGVSFYDVSDPAHPKELAFIPITPDGKAHGLDADDRYVYACSQFSNELNREGLQIIQCHEIVYYNDRVYAAWRDAGMVILDVKDRSNPKLIATYDYNPPFHGGNLGAAHTSAPVVVRKGEHPDLIVHTDEIFDCPPGFGRILDVSDLKNPEVVKGERPANVVLLSTFRFDYVSDNFDHQKKQFICDGDGPGGRSGTTTHLPWFDQRSPSLVYITWYDEGVRVMDISNPFAPVFTGYFLSPRFGAPAGPTSTARKDRHTREIFQDPDTGLLYLTDGNGAGLMVLRYTGPIPDKAPIPGGR